MKAGLVLSLTSLTLLSGCVSTAMYTPDGYLTEYGAVQTRAGRDAILEECSSTYQRTENAYFNCLRDVIPLATRWGPEYAEIVSNAIYAGRNVVLGYNAGNISKETTIKTLDQIYEDFLFQEKIWVEQYDRVIGARNAREKELARRRMSKAMAQVGSELLKQSSSTGSTSITCRETLPGTVVCSEF